MPLALFGLDDTLLDRAGAYRTWCQRFVVGRGLGGAEAVAWLVDADRDGRADKAELFDHVRFRFGLDETVDTLVAEFDATEVDAYVLAPEIARALKLLRGDGWRTGIVTNGSARQHDKIVRTGLADLVDGWAVSGLEGVHKPDAALFELAAQRCGATFDDEAWMVGGDPVADIGGGHDLGLTTVWLHRERTWELQSYKPSFLVTSMPEAVTLMLEPDVFLPAVLPSV